MIRTMENQDEYLYLDDSDYDLLNELLERNLNRSGFFGQTELMKKAFPLMELVHSPEQEIREPEAPTLPMIIIDGSLSVGLEEVNYPEESKLKPRAWTTDDTQSVTDSGIDLTEMRLRTTSDLSMTSMSQSLNLTDTESYPRRKLRSTRRTTTNGSFSGGSFNNNNYNMNG